MDGIRDNNGASQPLNSITRGNMQGESLSSFSFVASFSSLLMINAVTCITFFYDYELKRLYQILNLVIRFSAQCLKIFVENSECKYGNLLIQLNLFTCTHSTYHILITGVKR